MACLSWLLCIYCIWINLSPAESDSWSADIPDSVYGLYGSCVVIPCQFRYPGEDRKASDFTGVWLTNSNEKVYHSVLSQIDNKFKQRTSLLGDLNHGNCSLKINSLHHSDHGPFMFRIELKDLDNYSYAHNKVTVTVQDSPDRPVLSVSEEMKSGKDVTVTCSVLHSCLTDPPKFSWSHRGTLSSTSQQQTKGQWKITSTLSFNPSNSDNNKQLSCTAEFHGGKIMKSQTTLNVKYAPEKVEVISKASVAEGESLDMNCSSDSNPAPHKYQWFSEARTMLSEGYTYTLTNVSRHIEPIYCTTYNTEGNAKSKPIRVNIMYPPEIKSGTVCTLETSEVTCFCLVDSNPTSHISWWGAELSLELHKSSLKQHGTLTIGQIQGVPDFFNTVHCHATNSQGNYTMALRVPQQSFFQSHQDKILYISLAVAAFVIAIIVLSLWIVKSRKRAETGLTAPSKIEKNTTSPSDLERKCKDLFPSHYEDQHVQGNFELEDDDCSYENVTPYNENEYEQTYANV